MKIMAAIHWQALRLWIKGARLVPRPASSNTGLAPVPGSDYSQQQMPPRTADSATRKGALVQ